MKKIVPIFLFTCALVVAYGQPVFTADWSPAPGHVSVNNICIETPDAGPAGPNQVWDFSNVQISSAFPSISFTYVAPEDTPYADQFPEATVANILSLGGGQQGHGYYIANNEGFFTIGSASAFSTTVYTDHQKGICYPLAYGDSFEDTYTTETEAGGFIFEVQASATNTYDAYGTLILPTGTFENVGRLSQYRNERDSTDFGVFSVVEVTLDTTIGWIHPEHSSQIALVNRVRTLSLEYFFGSTEPDTTFNEYEVTFSYDDQVTINPPTYVEEISLDQKLTLLGNPITNGVIEAKLELAKEGSYEVLVLNQLGQTVYQNAFPFLAGNNQVVIQTDPSVRGWHYLVIRNAAGVILGGEKCLLVK